MLEQLEKLTSEGTYEPSKKLGQFLEFDSQHSNPEYYHGTTDEEPFEISNSENQVQSK